MSSPRPSSCLEEHHLDRQEGHDQLGERVERRLSLTDPPNDGPDQTARTALGAGIRVGAGWRNGATAA